MKAFIARTLCLVLLLSVALTGANAQQEKIITLTENWDFTSGFYPIAFPDGMNNYGALYWCKNLYQPLVAYDKNGDITGVLAENWQLSEDGKTYTFKLRQNVKFSDGTEMKADAVKASFDAAPVVLGAYNGSYGKLTAILKEVRVVDDYTVEVELIQPYYASLNDFSMICPMAIVNPKAYENGVEKARESCAKVSMGTGAYMFDHFEEDGTSVFVRNPYYWGEKPDADGFRVKPIPDHDAKLLALRAGEIDAIIGNSRISLNGYQDIVGNPEFGSMVGEKNMLTRYIGFNLGKAPFDDARVRRAVAYAVNQQLLSETVFSSLEAPAETLFTKDVPNCDVEQTVYETDLDKARALLDEAGWKDTDGDGIREKDGQKLETVLVYSQSGSSLDDTALAIASFLKEIGMAVTSSPMQMMTYYGAMMQGDYNMALYMTYGSEFDPAAVVSNMNAEIMADPIARQYSSLFDGGAELIKELDSTADGARVKEIYAYILTTLADNAAYIPLTYSKELGVWNSTLIAGYEASGRVAYVDVSEIKLK